jgi:flagellar biosynthesis protein FlhA
MKSNRLASGALPMFVIGAILMMVLPIPAMLLDLMLTVNIGLAILILITTILLKDSVEFSIFPSLLLVTTLTRLSLSVASTRLILIHGNGGHVIETFGHIVIGGSVVVGLVVFLILIVIQATVITHGAGRVAEVAARFTLDAMPGKQMAIDADLTSGLINEEQARERRKLVAEEADFYGAMDGASKFVKGDVMAGIVIVMVNLIGGFAIGVGQNGMSFGDAISHYSLLTIGEGLVAQIPALLISIATGLLVTRVGDGDLGGTVANQLFAGGGKNLKLAGGVLAVFALLPGIPKLPFLLVSGVLFLLGTRNAGATKEAEAVGEADAPVVKASPDTPEALISEMRVEPLELHLSYDILDLIDTARGGDLLERVRALRRQIAMELGVVMPFVRTRDDVTLAPNSYRVLVHGTETAKGTAPRDQVLALPMGDGSELRALGGTETVEPVFGLLAFWVPDYNRSAASASGATVVDRSSVIVTHMAEVVRRNAARLLSRQDVQMLVEGLRYEEPLLANEVGTEHFPLSTLHAVLRGLLDDGVGIRDISRIVECASAKARETRSIEHLVATCRVALAPSITTTLAPGNRLAIIVFDPQHETSLHEALREIDGETRLVLEPHRTRHLQQEITQALTSGHDGSLPVAVVCSQALRKPLHRMLQALGVDVSVIAYPELPNNLELVTIGVVGHARVEV